MNTELNQVTSSKADKKLVIGSLNNTSIKIYLLFVSEQDIPCFGLHCCGFCQASLTLLAPMLDNVSTSHTKWTLILKGIHACINRIAMWGGHLFLKFFFFLPFLLSSKWNWVRLFSWVKKIRVLATTIIHWAAKQTWLRARHSCSSRVVQWSASPRRSWPLWLLDHDKGNSKRHTYLLCYCSYGDFNRLHLSSNPEPTPNSNLN